MSAAATKPHSKKRRDVAPVVPLPDRKDTLAVATYEAPTFNPVPVMQKVFQPNNSFHFYENNELKQAQLVAMRLGRLKDSLFFTCERDQSQYGNAAWMTVFKVFFEDVSFAAPDVLPRLVSLYRQWFKANMMTNNAVGRSHASPSIRAILAYAVAIVTLSPKCRAIANLTTVAAASTNVCVIKSLAAETIEKVVKRKDEWNTYVLAHPEAADEVDEDTHADEVERNEASDDEFEPSEDNGSSGSDSSVRRRKRMYKPVDPCAWVNHIVTLPPSSSSASSSKRKRDTDDAQADSDSEGDSRGKAGKKGGAASSSSVSSKKSASDSSATDDSTPLPAEVIVRALEGILTTDSLLDPETKAWSTNALALVDIQACVASQMIHDMHAVERREVDVDEEPGWIADALSYCLEGRESAVNDAQQFWRVKGKTKKMFRRPATLIFRLLLRVAQRTIKSKELVFHLLCCLEVMFREISCDRWAIAYAVSLVVQYRAHLDNALACEASPSDVQAIRFTSAFMRPITSQAVAALANDSPTVINPQPEEQQKGEEQGDTQHYECVVPTIGFDDIGSYNYPDLTRENHPRLLADIAQQLDDPEAFDLVKKAIEWYDILPPPALKGESSRDKKGALSSGSKKTKSSAPSSSTSDEAASRKAPKGDPTHVMLPEARSIPVDHGYLTCETHRGCRTNTLPLLKVARAADKDRMDKYASPSSESEGEGEASGTDEASSGSSHSTSSNEGAPKPIWTDAEIAKSHGEAVDPKSVASSEIVPPLTALWEPSWFKEGFVPEQDFGVPGSETYFDLDEARTVPHPLMYSSAVIGAMERIPWHVTPTRAEVAIFRRAVSVALSYHTVVLEQIVSATRRTWIKETFAVEIEAERKKRREQRVPTAKRTKTSSDGSNTTATANNAVAVALSGNNNTGVLLSVSCLLPDGNTVIVQCSRETAMLLLHHGTLSVAGFGSSSQPTTTTQTTASGRTSGSGKSVSSAGSSSKKSKGTHVTALSSSHKESSSSSSKKSSSSSSLSKKQQRKDNKEESSTATPTPTSKKAKTSAPPTNHKKRKHTESDSEEEKQSGNESSGHESPATPPLKPSKKSRPTPPPKHHDTSEDDSASSSSEEEKVSTPARKSKKASSSTSSKSSSRSPASTSHHRKTSSPRPKSSSSSGSGSSNKK